MLTRVFLLMAPIPLRWCGGETQNSGQNLGLLRIKKVAALMQLGVFKAAPFRCFASSGQAVACNGLQLQRNEGVIVACELRNVAHIVADCAPLPRRGIVARGALIGITEVSGRDTDANQGMQLGSFCEAKGRNSAARVANKHAVGVTAEGTGNERKPHNHASHVGVWHLAQLYVMASGAEGTGEPGVKVCRGAARAIARDDDDSAGGTFHFIIRPCGQRRGQGTLS